MKSDADVSLFFVMKSLRQQYRQQVNNSLSPRSIIFLGPDGKIWVKVSGQHIWRNFETDTFFTRFRRRSLVFYQDLLLNYKNVLFDYNPLLIHPNLRQPLAKEPLTSPEKAGKPNRNLPMVNLFFKNSDI